MNYDPAEYFRLTSDEEECPECGEDSEHCYCATDDEEWWEDAESEVAALDREEQRNG